MGIDKWMDSRAARALTWVMGASFLIQRMQRYMLSASNHYNLNQIVIHMEANTGNEIRARVSPSAIIIDDLVEVMPI